MQALLWSTPTTTTLRAQSNLSRLTEKFKTLLSKQEETDKSVGKEEEECYIYLYSMCIHINK